MGKVCINARLIILMLFNVTATSLLSAQSISSIAPNNGSQGAKFQVTVTGSNTSWQTGPYSYATLTFSGTGVSASNVVIKDSNTITADVTIDATASMSSRTLTLYYNNYFGGGSYTIYLNNGFTVTKGILPTNEWVSFWGDTIKYSGYPVSTGSVVRAYDPQGILCGEFYVTTAGKYGLMPVYRDDALTADDEGAQPGDTITFTINGVPVVPLGPNVPVWTSNGAVIKVNMKSGPDPVPPSAPSANSAYGVTATQFSASWSYVNGATDYLLDVALDSTFTNYVNGYQNKSLLNTYTMVIGLTTRTKYFYRVRAVNIAGPSGYSNIVSATTAQAVVSTNEWVSFWSDTITNSGYPVTVGAVVRAFDPQGILCGEFTVNSNGKYGLMSVYRDDALTTADEGAQPGDTISFSINNSPATVLGPGAPVWSSNGAVVKLNMKIGVDPVPPAAPTIYSAYNIQATQFSAEWSYVSNATGYLLDVALDSGFTSYVSGYQSKNISSTYTVVSGLIPRTKYFFRVRGINIAGAGSYSTIRSVTTSQAVVATNEWVSFWSDTIRNSGYPVSVGSVVRAYDPQGILCGQFTVTAEGKYGLMSVYRDDALTAYDEGAVPGDSIKFTINNFDATVLGPGVPVWSSNGSVIKLNMKIGVDPVPPPAPTAYSAYNIMATQFSAQWSFLSNVTGYLLDVSLDSSFTNFVSGFNAKIILTTNFTVTGLNPRTTYYYRVRGINIAGPGSYSNIIKVTTIQAVVATNEWVSFWGDTISINGSPVNIGAIVRAYDPQGTLCGEFSVVSAGKYGLMSVYRDDALTTQDEGAQPGDTISFTVNGMAVLMKGPGVPVWTSNGAVVKLNFGTLPYPAIPQNISAQPVQNSYIQIKWDASTYAAKYYVYRYDTVTLYYQLLDSTVQTYFNDMTVLPNRTYTYRVVAINLTGASGFSSGSTTKIIINPVLQLLTDGIIFPNTKTGDRNELTAKVTAGSITDVTITSLTFQTNQFSIGTTLPKTIHQGDTLSITVYFQPTTPGVHKDTLTITSNSGTHKMAVSGTSPLPLIVIINPTGGLVFPNTKIGIKNELIAKVTAGSIADVTITALTFQTNQFSIGISLPVSIRQGDTLSIPVYYQPTTLGVHNDTLTITSNSGTHKMALSGTSPQPQLVILNPLFEMGEIGFGDTVKTTLGLTNGSINNVVIDSIYLQQNLLSIAINKITIGINDTIRIPISFVAKTYGEFRDTIFLLNKALNSTIKVGFHIVIPYPLIAVNTNQINFGTVLRNSTKWSNIMLTNTSKSKLSINSLNVSTSYFQIRAKIPPFTVVKLDTVLFEVSFTPDAQRTFIDTFYIYNSSRTSPYKIALRGDGVLTGISAMSDLIPTEYSLHQNYPNPFNPSTTIRFGIPQSSTVKITVYNLLGQMIQQLTDQVLEAGYYEKLWEMKMPSGIYFYRIEAVSQNNPQTRFSDIKKMVLAK